jgi:hypothetical protein
MAKIDIGTTFYLETLVLDSNGDPITSLSVSYKVIRSSDNTLLDSGSLTHIADGVYQSSYVFSATGQYRVLYITPTQYTDDIETILVEAISNSDIYDLCKRILGLSQENYRFTNQVYDGEGCLTSGKISIYSSVSDTDNEINPITEYAIVAVYNANKELIDYKVTEI